MSELTVILKDSDKTLRFKFLMYVPYTVSVDDPEVVARIEEAKKNFQGDPEEINVKIHLEIQ